MPDIDINAIDFAILFGHHEGDPFLDDFLSQFGPKPEFDPDDTQIAFLSYKDYGFSLHFKAEWWLENLTPTRGGRYILTALMFYAEGFEGFKEFNGQLPNGLVFSDNREKVRQKSDAPFASGGGGKSRLLGLLPEYDQYKLPEIGALMFIRYSMDKTRIDMVTFEKEQYRK
jgi:hypothetical protein